ncbi:MAG: hypothetical protein IT185_08150 [Acidobacteria bacterium]|nr:hypothetical protein [Acidobacteriota bacterium]
MSYTVNSVTPVLGGLLLRVRYTQDGGPEERAHFYTSELRRTTEAMSFADFFPLWARAQAAKDGVKLATLTLAQLRTLVVGKTLPAEPTLEAAKSADGV